MTCPFCIQRTKEALAVRERTGERWPLWCVDRGDGWAEHQYLGPFPSWLSAVAAVEDEEDHGDKGDWVLRRCRRVTAWDLDRAVFQRIEKDAVELFREELRDVGGAWADWEHEDLVRPAAMAEDGFRRWTRDIVEFDAFICQPLPDMEAPCRHGNGGAARDPSICSVCVFEEQEFR